LDLQDVTSNACHPELVSESYKEMCYVIDFVETSISKRSEESYYLLSINSIETQRFTEKP